MENWGKREKVKYKRKAQRRLESKCKNYGRKEKINVQVVRRKKSSTTNNWKEEKKKGKGVLEKDEAGVSRRKHELQYIYLN